MPTLVLTMKYNVGKIIMSPSTLMEEYLHGISLKDSDGRVYSITNIRKKIVEATDVVEHFLKIKTSPTQIIEQQDFINEEWMMWGHIKLEYVPTSVIALEGWLNTNKILSFDQTMLVLKRRNIALVPASNNVVTMIWFNNAGVLPMLGGGVRIVPNFWHITYMTGFTIVPSDIIGAIAKFAAIQVLAVLGDIVLGSGISNESISFDGLSQSISSTNSSGNSAYGSRIKQYAEELKETLARLHNYYRGFIFETL